MGLIRKIFPRLLFRLPRVMSQFFIRRHVRPMYLGDHRAVCSILARYKFFVDTRDVGFVTHVLTDGFWEMWLTEFMARTIEEGMHVLDVGANFGYYSVLMADLVGPEGMLISFEPNPHAAENAEASLSLNGFNARSTVLRMAASDVAGNVNFCIPHKEPKNAAMVPVGFSRPDAEIIQVPTIPIDEVCRDLRRVDFVKIDAEGGEFQIFRGLQQIIKRDRPTIILEFNAGRGGAEALLALVAETYHSLKYLGYDGKLVNVAPEQLMSDRVGEDWLLLLK